jgi:hypothetical protein
MAIPAARRVPDALARTLPRDYLARPRDNGVDD